MKPIASIIIPAHNEEAILDRSLRGLTAEVDPGEFEIIVICNGCTDSTEKIARRFKEVTVLSIPVASKAAALNAGDRTAQAFPRFYLDADVVVTVAMLRHLTEVLANGSCLVATPFLKLNTSNLSFWLRAYFFFWRATNYHHDRPVGMGLYGVNKEGRRRFGVFPELLSEDEYVARHFSLKERYAANPAVWFEVFPPRTLKEMILQRARWMRGNRQLPPVPHRSSRMRFIRRLLGDFRLWFCLPIYLFLKLVISLVALFQGDTSVWKKDESSREHLKVRRSWIAVTAESLMRAFPRGLTSRLGKIKVMVVRALDPILPANKGPLKVLFVADYAVMLSCQLPVIKEMEKRGIKIAITSIAGRGFSSPDAEHQLYFEKYYCPLASALFSKWDYVVHSARSSTYVFFLRDSIHLYIPHGVCYGNNNWIHLDANWSHAQVFLGTNQNQKESLERFFPELFQNPNKRVFVNVGFPKCDATVKRTVDRRAELETLGLDPDRKTILLTSHWTSGSLLGVFGTHLIKQLSPLSDGFNIIHTAHPNLWQQLKLKDSQFGLPQIHFKLEDFERELTALATRHPNIHWIPTSVPSQLFPLADLLIADYSSMMTEFLIQKDAPVLFYDNPAIQFYDPRVYRLYKEASVSFTRLEEINNHCLELLKNPERSAEGRERLRRYFQPDYPGESARYITELVLKLGRLRSTQLARWQELTEGGKPSASLSKVA